MTIRHLDNPVFKSVKADGSPNSLGTIGVYEAGTSFVTTVTIWDTQTKDSILTNPVTLNSAGEKEIWFDDTVDIQIKDSDGNVLDQILNVSSSPTATATGNYNLVQNGSFEIDTDGDSAPDNWTLAPDTGGTIAIDSTSGGQTHGANGLKFTGTGSGGGTATSTKFDVLAGKALVTEFSYKSSAATTTNSVVIKWYKFDDSASSTPSTTVHSLAAGNPSSFTSYYYRDAIPSDATKAEIVITGVASGGTDKTGPTWFDNISVTQSLDVDPHVYSSEGVKGQDGMLETASAQASTSGTEIDFTSIPAWAKQITITFDGVSTNAAGNYYIAIGDSGGFELSGYISAAGSSSSAVVSSTGGFFILTRAIAAASSTINGSAILTLVDSSTNTWAIQSCVYESAVELHYSAGTKSLSGTLDRIRVTTVGPDTFDAGKINIVYSG